MLYIYFSTFVLFFSKAGHVWYIQGPRPCSSFIALVLHTVRSLILQRVSFSKHSVLLTFLNSNGPWTLKWRHKQQQQHTLHSVHCQKRQTFLLHHHTTILSLHKVLSHWHTKSYKSPFLISQSSICLLDSIICFLSILNISDPPSALPMFISRLKQNLHTVKYFPLVSGQHPVLRRCFSCFQ